MRGALATPSSVAPAGDLPALLLLLIDTSCVATTEMSQAQLLCDDEEMDRRWRRALARRSSLALWRAYLRRRWGSWLCAVLCCAVLADHDTTLVRLTGLPLAADATRWMGHPWRSCTLGGSLTHGGSCTLEGSGV